MDTLNTLKDNEKAVVLELTARDETRRRLQDIGLINGTQVVCLLHSPLGDPVAFYIRGAVIALRSEDAAGVIVRKI
ncbi:MAG: ferrous iron transport protein A [Clostridia bacterium]|nr:ferrous iron transport protein A [Clostridia bacterium]